MTDPTDRPNGNSEPDIGDLDRRLKAARVAATPPAGREASPDGEISGVSQAMRVGTELVAALVVGVGLGWFLDGWLGTRPWLMIVFFFLGAGAGILNVYRATGQMPGPGGGDNKNNDTNDLNDKAK